MSKPIRLPDRIYTAEMITKAVKESLPKDITLVHFFFSDPKTVEKMLQIITKDSDLHVVGCMNGREFLRADRTVSTAAIIAYTEDGRIYNIEFQDGLYEFQAKTMFIHVTNLSEDLAVPDSLLERSIEAACIVFAQQVPYDVDEVNELIGLAGNGFVLKFITEEDAEKDPQLKNLYHDLQEADPEKMFIDEMKQRATQLKTTKGGRMAMELSFRDYANKITKQNAMLEKRMEEVINGYEEKINGYEEKVNGYEEKINRYETEINDLKSIIAELKMRS